MDSWIGHPEWEPQGEESWLTAKEACDGQATNWKNKSNMYRGVDIPEVTHIWDIC